MVDVNRSSRTIGTIGVVARRGLRAAAPVLADMIGWLEARGLRVILESETASLADLGPGRRTAPTPDLPKSVDLVVILGGDGTLLGVADQIAEAGVDVPVLGVNFGSLGFLTEVTLDEIRPALEATIAGTARIDTRLMLGARVTRDGHVLVNHVVLNDVVVTRGPLSPIIELSVSVGTEFVTRVRADGLIVASPTGSTAYNLAAGGPIVHPSVDALVMTPIAPHTLTNRPVVIPTTTEVIIESLSAGGDYDVVAMFDGHSGFRLQPGDTVGIRTSKRPLRLVRSTRTYFEVLRQKLKWGER